ncbi:MAG TPA: hypothetical protein PLR25_26290 [Planctomycetaceae bacterium]|nr:hypothetical protein [Planctomycetaceae bacterium]
MDRELYDHDNGPGELTNLTEIDNHKATVDGLSKALQDAVASTLPPNGTFPELLQATWALPASLLTPERKNVPCSTHAFPAVGS